MASNSSAQKGRIIADFERGRISAKQAARAIKKAAARKGRKPRRAWK